MRTKRRVVSLMLLAAISTIAMAREEGSPTLLSGGGSATFESDMPSFLFAADVLQNHGELSRPEEGMVALESSDYVAIFGEWDAFQSYAKCSGGEDQPCIVTYFDRGRSEIRRYDLPLVAARSRHYLTALSEPTSPESLRTPPKGSGFEVVESYTPSAGFSRTLRYGPADLHKLAPGIIAIEVPGMDHPHSIYAAGNGFEAGGHCIGARFDLGSGCFVHVFDYKSGHLRRFHMKLTLASEMETYEELLKR